MSSKAFERLSAFIRSGMRMSHIYQPVMLQTLLRNGGTASIRTIALSLLQQDQSQIEYYEQITKRMVGRVLTSNRGITEREGSAYRLKGFDELAPEEIEALLRLCEEKVADYLSRRSDPWSHRRTASAYVPGTIRYEVLKRAKFRCELCGIPADERALEVDHIIPRSRGGENDPTNLQALCYICNSMKRDTDDTDFRNLNAIYATRNPDCVFCAIDGGRVLAENRLAYAIRDGYPVTCLHTLIVPKRHVSAFFDLLQPERNVLYDLLENMKDEIERHDPSVSGFNIGVNNGAAAGQTIFHCHIHLIPRRRGDTQDPRGGVRGVIPSKQSY
jgi:ATP adenylyltransferase